MLKLSRCLLPSGRLGKPPLIEKVVAEMILPVMYRDL